MTQELRTFPDNVGAVWSMNDSKIRKGDIVLHRLSKLYFICENDKQARWMNENIFYTKSNGVKLPVDYFKKNT